MITYQYQLDVYPSNKIMVPGCEPSSALSSRTLAAYIAAGKLCNNVMVDLDAALAAIPGSTVKFGANFNRGGSRQKWFVLPPINLFVCPCQTVDDYYDILRQIPGEDAPLTEEFDKCNMIGMGYCPSPDFDNIEAPPADPFQPEGTFSSSLGGNVLPPVPPWAMD